MSDEQATRPPFKVGQVWRTRGGKQCTIRGVSFNVCSDYPIQSDLYTGHFHYIDGRSCLGEGSDFEDDLIELISAAPEPAPAHQPDPVPPGERCPLPRLFAAPIRRTKLPHGGMIVDAIADDGTAWFMVLWTDPNVEAPAPCWHQLPPLPQPEAE
jgi:hypothetical protein